MVKKSKKVWTAVAAALLVLSVGYFAMLAPTTAWFYEDYNTRYAFTFGNFDMNQEERTIDNETIRLRAATRFADAGEVLFDEVVHVVKVDAENEGSIQSQVEVTVETTGTATGLRWFVYDTEKADEIPDVSMRPLQTTAQKGAYKSAIENMLSTYFVTPLDYATLIPSTAETQYAAFDATAKQKLDAYNARKILFNAGEQKVLYVVFWVEYGDVASTLDVSSVANLPDYHANIKLKAAPYIPETQTLQLVNSGSVEALMQLYLNGNPSSYTGSYTIGDTPAEATSSTIHVPQGSTATIVLEVGTPYKLLLINKDPLQMNTSSTVSDGTFSDDATLTGTVSNIGNRATILDRSGS